MSGAMRERSLNEFLNRLDEFRAPYRIRKIRSESIMVEVVVPGEHWEIEFMDDGTVEIERFRSSGEIRDEKQLEELWPMLE